jgi:hypothetical protein
MKYNNSRELYSSLLDTNVQKNNKDYYFYIILINKFLVIILR